MTPPNQQCSGSEAQALSKFPKLILFRKFREVGLPFLKRCFSESPYGSLDVSVESSPISEKVTISCCGEVLGEGEALIETEAQCKAVVNALKHLVCTNYYIKEKESYFARKKKGFLSHLQEVDPSNRHIYRVVMLNKPSGPPFPRPVSGAIDYVTTEADLWQYIRDYGNSGNKADLYILNIEKSHRETVRGICQQTGMIGKPLVGCSDRGMWAYRNANVLEILDELKRCGGENIKYVLHSPGSDYQEVLNTFSDDDNEEEHHDNDIEISKYICDNLILLEIIPVHKNMQLYKEMIFQAVKECPNLDRFIIEKTKDKISGMIKAEAIIDSHVVGRAKALSEKVAKDEAAERAWSNLRQRCKYIEVKKSYVGFDGQYPKWLQCKNKDTIAKSKIYRIISPKEACTLSDVTRILKQFWNKPEEDLFFLEDFSEAERQQIYTEAQAMNFLVREFGDGETRGVCVYKKKRPRDIYKELLKTPYKENEKYKLIEPPQAKVDSPVILTKQEREAQQKLQKLFDIPSKSQPQVPNTQPKCLPSAPEQLTNIKNLFDFGDKNDAPIKKTAPTSVELASNQDTWKWRSCDQFGTIKGGQQVHTRNQNNKKQPYNQELNKKNRRRNRCLPNHSNTGNNYRGPTQKNNRIEKNYRPFYNQGPDIKTENESFKYGTEENMTVPSQKSELLITINNEKTYDHGLDVWLEEGPDLSNHLIRTTDKKESIQQFERPMSKFPNNQHDMYSNSHNQRSLESKISEQTFPLWSRDNQPYNPTIKVEEPVATCSWGRKTQGSSTDRDLYIQGTERGDDTKLKVSYTPSRSTEGRGFDQIHSPYEQELGRYREREPGVPNVTNRSAQKRDFNQPIENNWVNDNQPYERGTDQQWRQSESSAYNASSKSAPGRDVNRETDNYWNSNKQPYEHVADRWGKSESNVFNQSSKSPLVSDLNRVGDSSWITNKQLYDQETDRFRQSGPSALNPSSKSAPVRDSRRETDHSLNSNKHPYDRETNQFRQSGPSALNPSSKSASGRDSHRETDNSSRNSYKHPYDRETDQFRQSGPSALNPSSKSAPVRDSHRETDNSWNSNKHPYDRETDRYRQSGSSALNPPSKSAPVKDSNRETDHSWNSNKHPYDRETDQFRQSGPSALNLSSKSAPVRDSHREIDNSWNSNKRPYEHVTDQWVESKSIFFNSSSRTPERKDFNNEKEKPWLSNKRSYEQGRDQWGERSESPDFNRSSRSAERRDLNQEEVLWISNKRLHEQRRDRWGESESPSFNPSSRSAEERGLNNEKDNPWISKKHPYEQRTDQFGESEPHAFNPSSRSAERRDLNQEKEKPWISNKHSYEQGTDRRRESEPRATNPLSRSAQGRVLNQQIKQSRSQDQQLSMRYDQNQKRTDDLYAYSLKRRGTDIQKLNEHSGQTAKKTAKLFDINSSMSGSNKQSLNSDQSRNVYKEGSHYRKMERRTDYEVSGEQVNEDWRRREQSQSYSQGPDTRESNTSSQRFHRTDLNQGPVSLWNRDNKSRYDQRPLF